MTTVSGLMSNHQQPLIDMLQLTVTLFSSPDFFHLVSSLSTLPNISLLVVAKTLSMRALTKGMATSGFFLSDWDQRY